MPRMTRCLAVFPATMKPPIPTLSPVSTRMRVDRLIACAPGVAVGVAVAVAVALAVAVAVGVGLAVAVALAVGLAVGDDTVVAHAFGNFTFVTAISSR